MNAPSLDLWSVVEAAGLNPKGRGRNFAFDCPDCGRKGKASGRRDGPWHCWSCEAKGNALTLARRFELADAELRDRPAPPTAANRNGVAPSTARAAWGVLEGCREVYRDRLAAYLEGVRRWPADLAAAGARVSGWAWIPDDAAELPRSLAWIARDGARRAAFALRDARGEVWTLERRWTAPTPPEGDAPKALRLPTRPEDREALAMFGHLPDAVAAAAGGEPVYLCEGGPDYLAAAAFARIEGRGAALGAHGHHGLPKVAAALRAGLEAAGVPAARVRVLCVPHLGDKGDVGELSMLAAADALAGAGAVHVARVPVDGAGKGDLADLAREGVAQLRAIFDTADLAHAAPLDVLAPDAAEHIGAAILRALQAADGPHSLALAIMPPGVGKTTATFERAATLARQRRRVIFALPDHANAAQKLAEFQAAFPDVPAVHAKGMPSLCELPDRYPDKREAIERAAASMGRRMCAGCPFASFNDGGGCEGWRVPKARPGVVTFAAHAGISHLARRMKPADLVILDELPALVDVRDVGPSHLASLHAGHLAAHRWYQENPGHGDFAAELTAVAAAFEAETPRAMHAARIEFARVVDALRARPAALDAAADVLAEVEADPGPDAPMPRPEDARRGAADRWPDAGAWTFVRTLARAVSSADPVAELGCLRLDATGTGWAFEVRRPFDLPAGVRVLALDATGERSRAEWEALALRHGRKLAVVTVTATGEKPAAATFYRTGRLRTGRLWRRVGRRVAFLADAPGTVANALLRAAGPVPCVVGVLTHKPAADALRWGLDLAADGEASPPPGAAFADDDCHALAVAELTAGLAARGWTFEIGHFGRDDRASNAFEGVDVLAVLGAPRPDWGAVAEDARALAIDPDTLGEARTLAATVQALARARHLRRTPETRARLFLAADFEAAPAGFELPGVAWTVEDADRSHAPTVAGLDAAREIAMWADRTGCLDVRAVVATLAPYIVGPKAAERLCKLEAERRGWITAREGDAGRKVYRPSLHSRNANENGAVDAHGTGGSVAHGGGGAPRPVVRSDDRVTAPKSLGNHLCTPPPDTPPTWPAELAPVDVREGRPPDDCDAPPRKRAAAG